MVVLSRDPRVRARNRRRNEERQAEFVRKVVDFAYSLPRGAFQSLDTRRSAQYRGIPWSAVLDVVCQDRTLQAWVMGEPGAQRPVR